MKKPWSITTTVRTPDRLRNFLLALNTLNGQAWDSAAQQAYQILLIQNRLYGHNSRQFYSGLPQDMVDLIDDVSGALSYEDAERVFIAKNYEDPAMRGRQSFNPLKKFGFVDVEGGRVRITDLGRLFLEDDFDLGEVFFKAFLKWQIPNPINQNYPMNDAYDIKPFVGTLRLIKAVNDKATMQGNEPKGISKRELSLFAHTLVHYQDIDAYATKIIALRKKLRGKPQAQQTQIWARYEQQFASQFLGSTAATHINKLLQNLRDYGDNTKNYFRLTRYIYIRGDGYYIDLESRRSIELDDLLAADDARAQTFADKRAYISFLSDIAQPRLPWETKAKLTAIARKIIDDIRAYESALQVSAKPLDDFRTMNADELKPFVVALRAYRQELQDKETQQKFKEVAIIQSHMDDLSNIYNFDNRRILIEKLSALGLHALNDALRIKANYPVGDDNEPTHTAGGNMPDIECFYESFNAICEVTMLTGRDQWYKEGQPVMRHLRDFENAHADKPSYCLFIAPSLHRDTINTFWIAVKYEYEGQPQRIIPITITSFVAILEVLLELANRQRSLTHADILRLYDDILNSSQAFNVSDEWVGSIPATIAAWKDQIVSQAAV